ncbi:hypothetical protein [Martelella sp. HB161492]|uniref:hypothetical protein n=1 Tax=Martelella sp. HB161492 TaxID=2720726 RepID=UPI001591D55A|nr:hypothetical protein [Martelella sp. HB161492]
MQEVPPYARVIALMIEGAGFLLAATVITAFPVLDDAKVFLLPAMLLVAWVALPMLTRLFTPGIKPLPRRR